MQHISRLVGLSGWYVVGEWRLPDEEGGFQGGWSEGGCAMSGLAAPLERIGLKPDNTGNLYLAANWVGDVLPTAASGLLGGVFGRRSQLGRRGAALREFDGAGNGWATPGTIWRCDRPAGMSAAEQPLPCAAAPPVRASPRSMKSRMRASSTPPIRIFLSTAP